MNWQKIGVSVLLGAALTYFVYNTLRTRPVKLTEEVSVLEVLPTFKFGFNIDSFHVEEFAMKPGEVVGELLMNAGVPYPAIHQMVELARDNYSVRKLRAGKQCALVRDANTCNVECFIYEPDPYSFIKYHVGEKVDVEVVEREVERCVELSGGEITSSLWAAKPGWAEAQSVSIYSDTRGRAVALGPTL